MNDDFLHRLRRDPDPDFAARLADQLAKRDDEPLPRPFPRSLSKGQRRWRTSVGVAVAAVLLLVVSIGAWGVVTRPQPVSAQAVLQKATLANVNGVAVSTYHYKLLSVRYATTATVKGDPTPGGQQVETEAMEVWGAFPDRWRIDFRTRRMPDDGSSDLVTGSVSNGTDVWSYNSVDRGRNGQLDPGFDVQVGALPSWGKTLPLYSLPIAAVPDQAGVTQADSVWTRCYKEATLHGMAPVAGRMAYAVDLGRYTCGASPAGATPTRLTIWIDKELGILLKMEERTPDGALVSWGEMTEVEINAPISPFVFSYESPRDLKNVQYQDLRPQPYRLPDSATIAGGGSLPGLVYRPTATP